MIITLRGFGQNVSLLPLKGSGGQGGQVEQEVVPRAYEVEVAAESEQPTCGKVCSKRPV